MIPVMEPGRGPDRRTGKKLYWREVRLCSARAEGKVQPVYGATLGNAETASWLWQQTAQAGGFGPKTSVHGVGDGACWIVDKFEENFGEQGAYLIDFYHVSQYLAAAAASISRNGKEKQWLRRQQGRLLNNQVAKVLRALIPHQEDASVEEAPVPCRLWLLAGEAQSSGLCRNPAPRIAHRFGGNRKRTPPCRPATTQAFGLLVEGIQCSFHAQPAPRPRQPPMDLLLVFHPQLTIS